METVKTWRDNPTGPEPDEIMCCECEVWQPDDDDEEWGYCICRDCSTKRDDGC